MADIKLIVDTKSVDRAIDKIDRLRTGVGRTSKTTQEYTQSTQRSTTATQQHTKATQSSAAALNQQTQSAQRGSKGLKQFASIGLQQVGYQVSDFAVQVQGGTSALVAFGQQGSQLAGLLFFLPGLFGAIAGAVTSIAIPVFTAFGNVLLNTSGGAKSFAEGLEELETAISKYKSAMKEAAAETTELNARFGSVSAAMKPFLEDLKELERIKAINRLEEQFERLEANSASFFERYAATFAGGASLQAELAKQLGLTVEQYENLNTQLIRLKESENTEDRVQAAAALRDIILSSVGGVDGMTKEMRAFYENLVQVSLKSGEFLATTEDAKDEAQLLKGVASSISFDGATSSAAALAEMLGVAKDEAIALDATLNRAAGIDTSKDPRLTPFGTPEVGAFGSFTGAGGQLGFSGDFGPDKRRFIASGESRRASGGGGGGGISAAKKQEQEFNKARDALAGLVSKYDEGVAEAEKLRSAQITVNDAVKAGVITSEQGQTAMQGYIQSLEDAKNPMADFVDNFAKQMADAFTSIVDGSKSASDAFKDMARSILEQAFRMAVVNPIINSIFGGVSGFTKLPSFFANGAAFSGGKVTPFADGGVVSSPTMFPMANGAGLMGEAGPEAIMPLKRGKNGKLGVQVEGSQQPVVINQSFNFQANGDDSVKRIIAQEAPRIANLTQKQIMDQRRRGGAMKSTFG